MAPKITLYLVRHAQGLHNLNEANHKLLDPDLTDLGKQQCQTLHDKFPYHSKITHLVASPLRRTLYTCLLSFKDEVSKGIKIKAQPLLQETSNLPCDTGSPPEKLKKEFGDSGYVDLSLVHEGWDQKKGIYAPEAEKVRERAREARRWVRDVARKVDVPEVHVAIVTHGGLLHYITEDFEGVDPATGTGWSNTEYRVYEFKDPELKDENASLVETRESWERRKKTGEAKKPMTEAEKRNIEIVKENS